MVSQVQTYSPYLNLEPEFVRPIAIGIYREQMGQLGVRKGSWTDEEDFKLRKCINKYGEGKWHLVPLRSGLNRCRKSCRLRWLNYLRPNIKRGDFSEDEIDLIIRLHKLLGNRWSLIAGRIPNRTANEIKNYWNTHLMKKLAGHDKEEKSKPKIVEVIRPQPRTFTTTSIRTSNLQVMGNPQQPQQQQQQQPQEGPSMPDPSGEHSMWWRNLLNGDEIKESSSVANMIDGLYSDSLVDDIEAINDESLTFFNRGGQWEGLMMDMDFWLDPEACVPSNPV